MKEKRTGHETIKPALVLHLDISKAWQELALPRQREMFYHSSSRLSLERFKERSHCSKPELQT
jgi:hypothetical protein